MSSVLMVLDNFDTNLRRREEISFFSNHTRNDHDSAKTAREKRYKPCKIDQNIPLKILFHYPPGLNSFPIISFTTLG